MTDLATAVRLSPATSQLPVGWYHDEKIFALEQETVFAQAPNYVGHELMVPHPGDYRALERFDQGRILVRRPEGPALLSNICRHRQALMLTRSGQLPANAIICPIHRWTYDMKGDLLGAPHFPDKPCASLPTYAVQNWKGLLFEQGSRQVATELQDMLAAEHIDFTNYHLDRVMINECRYNWKTFIEVFLEDYHVEPFHPGLSNFVRCEDLRWQFGEHYSVQTVGLNTLQRSGSETYQRWHQAVLNQYPQETLPKLGAIWMVYYPGVMIEWYPNVLVVSTLVPRSPQHTTNIVEFYYPEHLALFEPDFALAEQAAYMETAQEDDIIAERIDQGRKLLWLEGRDDAGPYQSPLEDGMQHFHEYMQARLKSAA